MTSSSTETQKAPQKRKIAWQDTCMALIFGGVCLWCVYAGGSWIVSDQNAHEMNHTLYMKSALVNRSCLLQDGSHADLATNFSNDDNLRRYWDSATPLSDGRRIYVLRPQLGWQCQLVWQRN